MRVIKRFNNNIVLCIDNNGREIVAFGKALGFRGIPYELTDLSQIERSYYGIENRYMSMINELSSESLELSSMILDWCRMEFEGRINPNMLFTMADHIDFSIKRYNENIKVKMPLYFDFSNLHPKEFAIGKKAIRYINEKFNVTLPTDEIVGIAMNILNAELDLSSNKSQKELDEFVDDIIKIIEFEFEINIDKNFANYARFFSHMQYLVKRIDNNEIINGSNKTLYDSISSENQKASICASKINDYIVREKKFKLNQEELLYLIIHINRLCVREECYQTGITSKD